MLRVQGLGLRGLGFRVGIQTMVGHVGGVDYCCLGDSYLAWEVHDSSPVHVQDACLGRH